MKQLVIQYVPHSEISGLDGDERIKKLLKVVKEDKIVLLEGQLRKTEEASLIAKTMGSIDKRFKGIELASIDVEEESFAQKLKNNIARILLGNRTGLTIIGPATIVQQIKKDPKRLQLFQIDLS